MLIPAVWCRECADVLLPGMVWITKGSVSAQVKCRDNPAEWMFLPSSFWKLSSNSVPYFVNFLLEMLFLALWHIFVSLSQQHDCIAFMAQALQVTCQLWLIPSSIACASRIPTQFSSLWMTQNHPLDPQVKILKWYRWWKNFLHYMSMHAGWHLFS